MEYNVPKKSFMTSKQLTLSWAVVAVAALLLTACNPIPAEPPVPASVPTPGSACAVLNEMAREALASTPASPARARFDAADRKAFAGSAFGYLCELTEEVGPRESATQEELEAAEFLIDRFTEFGYSPEVQDFGKWTTVKELRPPPGPSRNIILELPGRGEGVVILGAHYDTTPDSVGANDNASGIGVLLALAERLARPPWSNQAVSVFPFTLRFIAFGSEETGLHGSWHYVDQLTDAELADIRVMINLDSVGSGTTLSAVGNPWLTRHVSEAAEREGVFLTIIRRWFSGGFSDYFSFADAWVPTIFFSGDDKSRINSPYDTIEFINPALLGDAALLVLDLLVSLEDLQCGCR
ncbi:MAG: M28 family peptidase [Caldilineaceae bacterium SB0661_bin_32]|uniref:M28 family peptidase n=1 Tax=Caldilineaceae bacterium SB0661_bin_32 TaxID=2605255 RepID=A0A6B1D233_9CHLR|nr:M28 family peptidase [Caldilineaceae bacterium SB0661_bin_32]